MRPSRVANIDASTVIPCLSIVVDPTRLWLFAPMARPTARRLLPTNTGDLAVPMAPKRRLRITGAWRNMFSRKRMASLIKDPKLFSVCVLVTARTHESAVKTKTKQKETGVDRPRITVDGPTLQTSSTNLSCGSMPNCSLINQSLQNSNFLVSDPKSTTQPSSAIVHIFADLTIWATNPCNPLVEWKDQFTLDSRGSWWTGGSDFRLPFSIDSYCSWCLTSRVVE